MSGVQVSDELIDAYKKWQKKSNGSKYILFRIQSQAPNEVVPCGQGDPSLSHEESFNEVMSIIDQKKNVGRYIVLKVNHMRSGNETESLVFLMYRGKKPQQKMLYSMTSKVVKDEISVKHAEEFGNTNDLTLEYIQNTLKNKI
eukprot:g5574.t1